MWKSHYYAMTSVTKNYDVCDIFGFEDSVNRRLVEDNTRTNLISYWVAKFQNLRNMSLKSIKSVKTFCIMHLQHYSIGFDFEEVLLWKFLLSQPYAGWVKMKTKPNKTFFTGHYISHSYWKHCTISLAQPAFICLNSAILTVK